MATILIVDDSLTQRSLLGMMLGTNGHRLVEAADGAEALAMVRHERPDLVITDILMPTMDGYEFVHQLRADPEIATVPVIFCTAHYHEQEAQKLARACGVASVLIKPCEPEIVLSVVAAVLNATPVLSATVPTSAEEFDREHLRVMTDKLAEKVGQLRIANSRLTALVELCLNLGSERDPQRLLATFCRAAREIIGTRCALVGVPTGGGLHQTSGMSAELARQLKLPDAGHGVLAIIFNERRTYRAHFPNDDSRQLELPEAYPSCRSFLGVPIVSHKKTYGWICLFDRLGTDAFSEEDERLAGILAAQVGRIYENGSLYADMQHHSAKLEMEVADRKRAEQALQQSEAQSRLLLDSTAEAIYGLDMHGFCTFCNPACLRLLGYSQSHQLLGKNMHALIHHTRADGTPYPAEECRIFLAFRKGEGSHVDDEVIWRADGSSFPAEYWSYPIRCEGRVVGSVVTFLDITERKRLENQFLQAQERMRHVVASSPSVLFTLPIAADQIQGISWTSGNLPDVLGYSPEAALGQDWWLGHVHPEDRDQVIAQFQANLGNQERSTYEYRFRHGDGRYRWTRCELRMVRDAAGLPAEVVGSWTDITERKQLEDQVRQSQKMEAIGRLAGGVAHDFNNLLTIINGYGELLAERFPRGDPTRELLGQIVAAGDRAAGLTRQLLAFSRKAIIEPRILDLKAVVADVEKMLRRIIGEDIELTYETDPEPCTVKADPGQMEQVIMNLVVNARDAVPQRGLITIEVRNAELDETYARDHVEARPGPHVLLAISDTGCGMDRATMARIFEPFFSTKGEKGTGLGLATVHGIVKQSGGHIAVHSEVGHGTTFKVYLPRVQQRPSGKSHPGKAVIPHGNETVLLVEDEAGVRALTLHILKMCGYTVLEARDGTEALRIAGDHQGQLDLLVTDVVMPSLGGRELAERLAETHPKMKVLFLSGYTDDAVVRHGILEAAVAFLQKPFSLASLATKVREVLDSQ